MRHAAVLLTVALAVGITVGMIGNHVLIAQQAPVTRTTLQQ